MTQPRSSPTAFTKNTVIVGSAKPREPRFRLGLRHVFGAVALVLALVVIYLFSYEPAYRGSLVIRPPRPLVFAHRGFGDHGPDNSLYAVEHALAAGMDGVDVDGQLTRDGELVIFHDLSVDRLTSGSGRVRDKTLKEMLALDLGPKYDSATQGAYVRTFEDFVRAVKGRGILMVELKVPGLAPTGIEQRAVEVIRKYDAHRSIVLSSFNPLVLYRVKRLDPLVRTALIFMDTNWNPELRAEIRKGDLVDLPWPLRQEFIRRALRKIIRPDLLSINHEVDESVVHRLIAKGWPAFIWTPDDEADIRQALSKRPYGVISDQPIRAKRLLGE
jgi:glycerophosphoryl diester phosphodiesterase